MAGNSAILTVKILTDASQAGKGADAAAAKFGRMGGAVRKAAIPAAGLGVALLAGAKRAVDAASRTQQAFGGLDAVFGSNANQMKKWASAAADSIGLSKSQYGELATLIGSQLKNAGIPMDQLAGKTDALIKTGGDLAAMYGGTTAEAVDALSSALKGEFDPMEKYGASLSATAIKAQMMADGTDKLTGKAAQQAKAQATLALVTQQTADAHGAAAREYDSAASAQARLSAKTENLMSDLGTVLLPVVSKLADAFSGLAAFTTKHTTATQVLVGVVAGFVVVILALNAAMSAYATITAAATAISTVFRSSLLATRVQLAALALQQKIVTAWSWLMSTGFRAAWLAATGPVGLVIIAVLAVVAVFVVLYKKSATFRNFVDKLWAAIKTGATAAANVVKRVWQVAWTLASAYVRTYAAVVRVVVNAIRTAVGFAVGKVKDLASAFRNLKVPSSIKTAVAAVKTAVENVINKVRDLASKLGNLHVPGVLVSAANGLKSAFDGVVGAVKDLVGWLGRLHVPKLSFPKIPKIFQRSVAAPAPGFRAASMRGPGATAVAGPSVVINVSGAIDPENTARQIKRILQGHDRRIGLRAS